MLMRFTTLSSFPVHARDTQVGKIKDVFFDDRSWMARYFVLDTRKWLPGKRVLVAPQAVEPILPDAPLLVNLTKEQIEHSPDESTDEPVSRQYEHQLHAFYGWTPYWASGITGTMHPYGPYVYGRFGDAVPGGVAQILEERRQVGDPDLRSCRELKGYQIVNSEGDIGSIADFFLDSRSWEILYLVCDTGDWLPGKKVVIPHHVIGEISWADRQALVEVPHEVVESSIEAEAIDQAPSREHGVMEHYFGYFLRESGKERPRPRRHGGVAV